MDIIEDLDLTGDLPEGFQFSLDDILEEYKTPKAPPRQAPQEEFPSGVISMEQDGPVAAGEISSNAGEAIGDPFHLGDILEEFASHPAPAAPAPEPEPESPPPSRGQVYEDEEGVKVYTPAKSAQTPPPASPYDAGQETFPTMKFKAVSSLLNRKKKPAKSAAPTPAPEADDARPYGEGYSDEEDGEAVYAAFGKAAEDAFGRDYTADFGLESSPDEEPEPPRRKKKRPAPADAAEAAGPVLSALSAARKKKTAPVEEAEDLGPEVTPAQAMHHYGSHIETYRSRLHIAVVLCVILGWLSLGLPVFGALKNTGVRAGMCLILELTVVMLGLDIFTAGIRNIVRKRADAQSLVAVSCVASAVDAAVILFTHRSGGYLPFCVVSAVSMCFAIYSTMLYCRGQRFNFRVLALVRNPLGVSLEDGPDGENSTITRTPGSPDEYIHTSEEEDLSETVFSAIAPFLLPAIPVLALLAAVLSKEFASFFHILAALFAAAASFSALLAFPLPYFLVSRDLFRSGTAIAGWAGVRDLGTAGSVIVTDNDLFPEDTVSIESVRILEGVDQQTAVSYVSSVIAASGSCLAPVFTELARKNNCVLRTVEEFKCHEAGGLTAMIDGAEVLVGSSTFMKLMSIHLPQKLSSKNSVFLAINSRLVGIITVNYKPVVSVQRGLAALLQSNAEVVFAARDFNVTPLLVSQKFKLPSDALNFPPFAERYRISDRQSVRKGQCVALLKRKTLFPYATLVTRARKLYTSVRLSVLFSVLSVAAGVLLMFFLCCTGAFASATPGNLLFFMLLWLVPAIVFAVGMTK